MASVDEAFAAAVERWRDRPLFAAPDGSETTYGEAARRVDALAARYRAAGWGGGHRVALLLDNQPHFFLHWLALNRLGAAVVPLNPDWLAAEAAYVLGHSAAGMAVALPGRRAQLEAAIGTGAGAIPVVDGEESVATPPAPAPRPDARPGDCAVLYTSGSTGRPKGCVLGDDYFLAAGRWYGEVGGLIGLRPGAERLLTPLPVFHMNAMAFSFMAMLLSGGCLIPLDRFHASRWWADLGRLGATIIHYLGVMPAILLARDPAPDDRAHSVRFGFGAGVDPRHHAAFEARFGFPLIEAWSMTEVGAGAVVAAHAAPRHVGARCFGRPDPRRLAWRLIDEAGDDVADGQPGELLVRGAGADPRAGFFRGYLGDDAATATAWAGGWFHTGDVVRRLDDGSFQFVDRRKNIIRRSGENIAALEVEGVLAACPLVRAAAVVAAPDELRGEEVLACVVAADGTARDAAGALAIVAHCRRHLAYHKVPGWVVFRDALPLTSTQKVQKTALAQLGIEIGRTPDCHDLRALKRPGGQP